MFLINFSNLFLNCFFIIKLLFLINQLLFKIIMDGKQSEYDFLKFSKDYKITNNITRDEEILFSDKVKK